MLGRDDLPGSLAWVAATRLAGTQATDPRWASEDVIVLLGQVAARLHSLPVQLPQFTRRIRDLPTNDADAHQVGTRLADILHAVADQHRPECERGFVHGDFSARNILLATGQAAGVIDFEGCGVGCVYEDLATLVMQDGLLGDRDVPPMLTGYTAGRAELGHPEPPVVRLHVVSLLSGPPRRS